MLPELVSNLETLPGPHILFDRRYRILAANAAYRRAFAPEGKVLGRTCHAVSHHFDVPCDQAGEACPLADARASGQRERVLHVHPTSQGEAHVAIELSPVRNAAGEAAYFAWKMAPLIGRVPAFLRMLARLATRRRLHLAPAALRRLQAQPFAGNVRGLRNVLERASLLSDGDVIAMAPVDEALALGQAAGPVALPPLADAGSLRGLADEALRQRLRRHTGNRAALARSLGISKRTLYRCLRALGETP